MTRPLLDWVVGHRVCFEASALPPRERAARPGFELALLARCDSRAIDPGRPCCQDAHRRLAELVRDVVPPGVPVHVEAHDGAVRLRHESDFAPEVELVAQVFVPAPVASRVRKEVEAALRARGARPRSWSSLYLTA